MNRAISNAPCWRPLSRPSGCVPWGDTQAALFASGREAVVALIEALDMAPGSDILLPAYVPEGIIAPFRRAKMRVHLYPLTRHLEPVWERLDELLRSRAPRLAVLIHYFGVPQLATEFCDRCRASGVLVLEDVAHALHRPESPIGRAGDFVLYSLPKMLPVPDGAPLVVRTPNALVKPLRFRYDVRHTIYLAQQIAQLCFATAARRIVSAGTGHRLSHVVPWRLRRLVDGYDTLMAYFERPNRMSRLSKSLLDRTDWNQILAQRRLLARLYEAHLSRDLFERFPGATEIEHAMVGFPVLVRDRLSLYEHLRHHDMRGVFYEHRWDFFPTDAGERELHSAAIHTMQHHFLFPTSQCLDASEVRRLIDVANSWRPEQRRAA